jgi:hypothetical protein
MTERRLTRFAARSTSLSLSLLVVVVASTLLAALPQPEHMSTYFAKSPTQPGWNSYIVAQAPIATPVPSTVNQPPQPGYQPPKRHIVRGAGRGAAVGAIGGATAGDPAKGAAAGAAMGGAAGVFRRRDQRMQQYPSSR